MRDRRPAPRNVAAGPRLRVQAAVRFSSWVAGGETAKLPVRPAPGRGQRAARRPPDRVERSRWTTSRLSASVIPEGGSAEGCVAPAGPAAAVLRSGRGASRPTEGSAMAMTDAMAVARPARSAASRRRRVEGGRWVGAVGIVCRGVRRFGGRRRRAWPAGTRARWRRSSSGFRRDARGSPPVRRSRTARRGGARVPRRGVRAR